MRVILALLLLATPLPAAITYIDSDIQVPVGSSTTIACNALNVTTGDLLVVAVRWFNGSNSIMGVADTAGNTYATRIAQFIQADVNMQVLDVQNATGNAANVITVTFSASSAVRAIICMQYRGVATSLAGDQTCTGTTTIGPTVACSSGITTTLANEVLIEFSEHNSGVDTTPTWDASFTEREQGYNGDGADFGAADRIVTSIQSFTPQVTWSSEATVTEIAFVSYKEAVAPGAGVSISPFILFGR